MDLGTNIFFGEGVETGSVAGDLFTVGDRGSNHWVEGGGRVKIGVRVMDWDGVVGYVSDITE